VEKVLIVDSYSLLVDQTFYCLYSYRSDFHHSCPADRSYSHHPFCPYNKPKKERCTIGGLIPHGLP